MKKLMIATAVAAAGFSSVLAGVYNIKFTATTTVDASKKVKGELVNYLKKGSVVVDGLFDDATGKYYFWTGTGAKMVPLANAVLTSENAKDMDSAINGKNAALNMTLFVGGEGKLESCFVAAGLGKVATVGGDDLVSASGSFGGAWLGAPAYGTWKYSKNASATKDLEAYLKKTSKNTLDLTAWGDNSALKEKLDSWREVAAQAVENAVTVKEQLEEIKGLVEELADAKLNVKELEQTKLDLENQYGWLENEWNNQKGVIADKDAELEAIKSELASSNAVLATLGGAFESLSKNPGLGSMGNLLTDYLNETVVEQGRKAAEAKAEIDRLNQQTNWYADAVNGVLKRELETAVKDAESKMQEASVVLSAAEAVRTAAYENLAYMISVTNGTFFTQNAEKQAEALKAINEIETRIQADAGTLKAYLNQLPVDQKAAIATLQDKTNVVAKMVVDAKDDLDKKKDASKAASKLLDDYTLSNGNGDYHKWLGVTGFPDTLNSQTAFNDWYAFIIADEKNKSDEWKAAEAQLKETEEALTSTTAYLDTVIAACEKGVLVSQWAEFEAKAMKLWEEHEAAARAKIAEFNEEIKSLKDAETAAKELNTGVKAFEDAYKAIRDAEQVVADKAAELRTAEEAVKAAEENLADLQNVVDDFVRRFVDYYGFLPTDLDSIADFFAEYEAIQEAGIRNVEAAKDLLKYILDVK